MSRSDLPTVLAVNTVVAHPDDDETYYEDFTNRLPTGVTIASAVLSQVKADGDATTDLTLGSAAPNAGTFTGRKGQTVAIGKGVLFDVTGGTAGEDYLITVTATGSNGSVYVSVCRFEVRDGTEDAA